MRLFKKKERMLSPKQEHAAGKIATGILKGQRKAADYLNAQTRHIPAKSWLWLLIGFFLLFGSYCMYLLVQVFN